MAKRQLYFVSSLAQPSDKTYSILVNREQTTACMSIMSINMLMTRLVSVVWSGKSGNQMSKMSGVPIDEDPDLRELAELEREACLNDIHDMRQQVQLIVLVTTIQDTRT